MVATDGDLQTAIATYVGYNGGSLGAVDVASLADAESQKRLRTDDPESMRCAKWDKEAGTYIYSDENLDIHMPFGYVKLTVLLWRRQKPHQYSRKRLHPRQHRQPHFHHRHPHRRLHYLRRQQLHQQQQQRQRLVQHS